MRKGYVSAVWTDESEAAHVAVYLASDVDAYTAQLIEGFNASQAQNMGEVAGHLRRIAELEQALREIAAYADKDICHLPAAFYEMADIAKRAL